MRTRWMTVLCLGAVCAVGACENADTSADNTSGAAVPADSSLLTADSVTNAPDSARALVALSGDGLMLVDPNTGSSRAITFGTDETLVIEVLTRALGAPGERGTNFDCGMGPLQFVEFSRGLIIAVQEGKFLGWSIHHNGESLRTMSNIGVLSTRAELESAYSAEIAPSSLGIEFMAGGLQGVLTSTADTARISDFWAGANCVAR